MGIQTCYKMESKLGSKKGYTMIHTKEATLDMMMGNKIYCMMETMMKSK